MHIIRPTRRQFLAASASAAALSVGGILPVSAALAGGPILLEARPGTANLLETSDADTPIWGYDGRVPGPVLRARQGGEIWVRFRNGLSQPTTIHWHGIRIANAMDGVAGLTQDPVPPGETFDYRFTVPDAGTFWYHPHNRSWEQVARGLYGALIVEERDAPDVDQDLIVIADDWRLEEDGKIHEASFGSIRDRAHAGRLGNILAINGKPLAEFKVRSGERLRLRLINTCNARVLTLRFEGLKPQVLAIDGQPVPPRPLKNEMATLGPGQRVDLFIRMTGAPGATQAITEVSQSRLVAARFVYGPEEPLPGKAGAPTLASNGLPEPDMASAKEVDLVMTGGAMGQVDQIVYKGESLGIRELVRKHGLVWAFNGVAGRPETPLFTARKGQTVAVRMVNDTRWPHAMHFHGHHFREAHSDAPWRDTLLMEASETRTVYFVADNPGKWMLHCHMLEHQAGGMATWFEVEA